jgi:hypothetical protein
VLLVDGVRPIDAVRTVDTLMVAYPEPLSVTGEVGDMLGDHVIQLGLACPEADAQDGLGVADASTDEVGVPAPEGDPVTDRVFTLGVPCKEADAHEPLGVTVPSPLELGVITADGDPVTVCPVHVIRGLGETVGCCDPLIPLGLPVGVGTRVGVSELSALDDTRGEPLPETHRDMLTDEVEL